RAIQPLLDSSLSLYRELVSRESLECEFESHGLLLAYRSRQAMEAYSATDRMLGESFGCPARRYDGDAVAKLEPALQLGLAGGWYCHSDCHLRPDKVMRGWRRVLEAGGVGVRENCPFHRFRFLNGRVVAADTAQGELAAEQFVVAAGAWTPLWNEH